MRKGFTLIELMIVIAIIAIIAAIAIPNLLESRITANESAAAATLKSGFHAAQTQFSAGAYSDLDADGRGEYANSHEWLAGSARGAAAPATAAPLTAAGAENGATAPGCNQSDRPLTLIAPTYRVADGTSIGAYRYQIDIDTTAFVAGEDMAEAESFWAGYAAPGSPGNDGRRSFAINVGGVVFATLATVTDANLVLAQIVNPGADAAAAATSMFASDPTFNNATNQTTVSVPYQK